MSAFLVSAKTMQQAVEAVLIAENTEWDHPAEVRAPVVTALGKELFALNQSALAARYGDNDPPPGFRGKAFDPPGRKVGAQNIQHLKSLQCLIYQCSEGEVPETALFKRLEAAEGKLALKIVQGLPAYEAARWAA